MDKSALVALLEAELGTMPVRLRTAARFVLDHPADVALLSMREQARRVGVSHTTMTRLATWAGLENFEAMRAIYVRALRRPDVPGDSPSAVGRSAAATDNCDVSRISGNLVAQVTSLRDLVSVKELSAAASLLAGSRHLFCVGWRSAHTVARHFACLMSQLGKHVAVLDPAIGVDAFHHAGPGDALLAIGFAPHGDTTRELTRQLSQRGVAIAAITDSKTSPLSRFARETIIVPTHSHSFFPSLVAALSVAEVLAALAAEKADADASSRRTKTEGQIVFGDIDLRHMPIDRRRATLSA